MSAGRTTWHARDGAHHDRELVVELLDEHGPAGPYVDTVLRDLAQQQRDEGAVRTGFRVLAKKCGIDRDECRRVVEHGAAIGLFDDLAIDADGRRFTCRISGWDADQTRGRSAWKKADQRSRQTEDENPPLSPPPGDMSPSEVDVSPPGSTTRHNQTIEVKTDVAPAGDVATIFDSWVQSTGRDPARTKLTPERRRRIEKALKSHGTADCLAAVNHIGQDPWAGGENDRGTAFNDVEHALGNAKRIERWRDWTPPAAAVDVRTERRRRRGAALETLMSRTDEEADAA